MSRHSKNNTASSVFTYGERQKLKQTNEWGQVHARVGDDSQKKFDQCSLCLQLLQEPLSCSKGHIFCKICIVENLMNQKKEVEKKMKEWDIINKNKLVEKEDSELIKRREYLKMSEDTIIQMENETSLDHSLLSDKELKRFAMIEDFKNRKSKISTKEKEELTKNCFWIPEKTPEVKKNNDEKPINKLYCPFGDKPHQLKLKDMIKLKIKKDEINDKFICCICSKDLSYQKIITIRKCGDVMCKKCFELVCKKESTCSKCNEIFVESDIIELLESGSGYALHNQVQSIKLNPYFKY